MERCHIFPPYETGLGSESAIYQALSRLVCLICLKLHDVCKGLPPSFSHYLCSGASSVQDDVFVPPVPAPRLQGVKREWNGMRMA